LRDYKMVKIALQQKKRGGGLSERQGSLDSRFRESRIALAR